MSDDYLKRAEAIASLRQEFFQAGFPCYDLESSSNVCKLGAAMRIKGFYGSCDEEGNNQQIVSIIKGCEQQYGFKVLVLKDGDDLLWGIETSVYKEVVAAAKEQRMTVWKVMKNDPAIVALLQK